VISTTDWTGSGLENVYSLMSHRCEGTYLCINEKLLFALLALSLMSGEITAQRAGLSDSDQDLPDAVRLRHHRSREGALFYYFFNYSGEQQTVP
jgi:hypothetical protein